MKALQRVAGCDVSANYRSLYNQQDVGYVTSHKFVGLFHSKVFNKN